jgi:hypothetical protein
MSNENKKTMKTHKQLFVILLIAIISVFSSGCDGDCDSIGEECSEDSDCCSNHCSEEGRCCLGAGESISSYSEEDCCSGEARGGRCCVPNGMDANDPEDCCSGLLYSTITERCLSPRAWCEEQPGCFWVERAVEGESYCQCTDGPVPSSIIPTPCLECSSRDDCPGGQYYTFRISAYDTACIYDCYSEIYGPIWASSLEEAEECAGQRIRDLGCVFHPDPTPNMLCRIELEAVSG